MSFDGLYHGDRALPETWRCTLLTIEATKVIRSLRGGAQSLLVECNDQRYYILKMASNPQGPNILANELIGTTLARSVGLPVAEPACISLSQNFLDRNPTIYLEGTKGKYRPDVGVHFGSRLVGDISGSNRPDGYLRRSEVHSVVNRASFLNMYIFDLWANHQDDRQAIFVHDRDSRQLWSIFIDHGHLFGGPTWDLPERQRPSLYFERSIYKELWNKDAAEIFVNLLQETIPRALAHILPLTPNHWFTGDLSLLELTLLERLENLPKLVARVPILSDRFESIP